MCFSLWFFTTHSYTQLPVFKYSRAPPVRWIISGWFGGIIVRLIEAIIRA